MDDARQRAKRGFATLQNRSTRFIDTYIPPDRRNDLSKQLQTWASQHPKLATLLALHATLTLPPLLLFTLFALTTTLTTLAIALTTAITIALATTFTILTLTFLLLLLPTLLLTTSLATILFLLAIATSTTSTWFANTSQPQISSFRASAAQRAHSASERLKQYSDGRIDLAATTQHMNTIGSPVVEGLTIYNEELAKMQNSNGNGVGAIQGGDAAVANNSARSSGSSGLGLGTGGEGGKGSSKPRANAQAQGQAGLDGQSEKLARQALGIPAE